MCDLPHSPASSHNLPQHHNLPQSPLARFTLFAPTCPPISSPTRSFTAALGGSGTQEENRKVALYYEGKGDALRAGEFWFSCKDYSKALRLFLQCGERAVDQAIEVVGRARSDMLTHQLIDFLMGETDGVCHRPLDLTSTSTSPYLTSPHLTIPYLPWPYLT